MKVHFLTVVFLMVCGCKNTTTVLSVRNDGSTMVVANRHEVQYNPGTRLFTFSKGGHPSFAPREIVAALQGAGIKPDEEILVNMHRFDDKLLIADIAKSLSNGGYLKYVFCTDQTAFSHGSYRKPFDIAPATAPPRREAEAYMQKP